MSTTGDGIHWVAAPPEVRERARLETSDLVSQLARSFAVPLLINPDRPELVGSGFFVHADGCEFLVSAAHVFDEFEDRHIHDSRIEPYPLVYTGQGTVRQLGGRLLRPRIDSPTRRLDVGVLLLQGDPLSWGSERRESIDVETLRRYARSSAREQLYAVAGFPETRVRATDYPTKRLEASPHGFVGPAIRHAKYDPEYFVVLEFEEKKKRFFEGETEPRKFPKPEGMSGSPVFALHYDQDWHPIAMPAAVVIERDEKKRAIVCTRMRAVVEMVDMLSSETKGSS